ncbi:O-antigen ligase family protein [Ornithinimicrobium panacihumi]|uniref:O-antigen ligase family protein n=1 Tax=Ornithinimicrobium panacihumi TaxID=2008449 RepID=UPI003F8AEB32
MSPDRREWLRIAAFVLVGCAAAALAIGVGMAVPDQPALVLAGVMIVLIGIVALANPAVLPLVAMGLIVVVKRAGGGPLEMTVSDWALALAFWPALIFSPRPFSKPLRDLLWANAAYQALTIFTLIANPFRANAVEWVHAWLLVSGALIVGWAVGRAGYARVGLTVFLVSCLLLALPTLAQAVLQFASGNFGAVYPRWPWPMHKNFIGSLLTVAAILLYARPAWMGWTRGWAVPAMVILVAAIAASQARQALIGLAVGLLVVSLRKHNERRRLGLALAAVLPIGYIVVTMVQGQIASGNQHNSWFQRLEWYVESFQIWTRSPWFGHGLRYWTQPDAPGAFQPPNAFLEVMASTGLVGLAGFLVLWVVLLRRTWQLSPTVGTVALALVLARLAQAQFDLFWVSISVSVPFLIVGVCLGVEAHEDASARRYDGALKAPRAPVAA